MGVKKFCLHGGDGALLNNSVAHLDKRQEAGAVHFDNEMKHFQNLVALSAVFVDCSSRVCSKAVRPVISALCEIVNH